MVKPLMIDRSRNVDQEKRLQDDSHTSDVLNKVFVVRAATSSAYSLRG
jgi:hypothetical protein